MSEGFNKNYINKAAVITPGSFANSPKQHAFKR
jgi:hypothetical protein